MKNASALRIPLNLVLFAIVGLGVLLRIFLAYQIEIPTHDGGISSLAATCNQELYQLSYDTLTPPFGSWASHDDWNSFFSIAQPGCFEAIAQNLINYDIHPPLYFWLLHIAFIVFGVSTTTALLMNVPFFLGKAAAVLALAKIEGLRPIAVASALAFFALSPAALASGSVARQYEMFAMWALWLGLFLIWASRQKRLPWWSFVGLATIVALGCVTHFQFSLVLVVGGAFVVYQRYQKQFPQPVYTLATMFIGGVIALLVLPK